MFKMFVSKIFMLKFLWCWVDYKNLNCIQLFITCVKGEHGEAVKTLLYLRLEGVPCL